MNIDVLPMNLATAGVQVTWEPFDWGRKRRELTAKAHAVAQARLAVRDAEDKAALEVNSRLRTLAESARPARTSRRLAQAVGAREAARQNQPVHAAGGAAARRAAAARRLGEHDDHYQQALLAFWTAKADFEHALGEEVTP